MFNFLDSIGRETSSERPWASPGLNGAWLLHLSIRTQICVQNVNNNEDIVTRFLSGYLRFVRNEMKAWEMLEVHYNLVRDTPCTVSFIPSNGASVLMLFTWKLWPCPVCLETSYSTNCKVNLLKIALKYLHYRHICERKFRFSLQSLNKWLSTLVSYIKIVCIDA